MFLRYAPFSKNFSNVIAYVEVYFFLDKCSKTYPKRNWRIVIGILKPAISFLFQARLRVSSWYTKLNFFCIFEIRHSSSKQAKKWKRKYIPFTKKYALKIPYNIKLPCWNPQLVARLQNKAILNKKYFPELLSNLN